jgi:hypothetical protein
MARRVTAGAIAGTEESDGMRNPAPLAPTEDEMPLLRKLATIATAAEAARRYAKKNPDKAAKYLDQAASFVDKQTKGKYTAKIDGVTQKVKGVAGVRSTPGASANGYPADAAAGYSAPQPSAATVPTPAPTTPTPTTPVAKPAGPTG